MKEVIFVKERRGVKDAVSQLRNGIIDYLDKAFNSADNKKTESMILPVVPHIKYPKNANVDNYEGIKENYNVPGKQKLETIEWSSIFPVNKNYSFQKAGSHINGYDYVDFLDERQKEQKPFRLISFETRTLSNAVTSTITDAVAQNISLNSILKFHFNGLVVVKDFDYYTDTVGDIKYSLTLEEFNGNIVIPNDNYAELGTNFGTNIITRYALKSAGLI